MSENEQGPTVSVVLPVKNGARHLREVLEAISRQRIDAAVEVLVVDSGSSDGSVEIARAAGARVIEIEPAEFGHGSTRNLAAERGPRRAHRVPDPGRDARLGAVAGGAGRAARRSSGVSACRSALTCRGRTRARWSLASWRSSSASFSPERPGAGRRRRPEPATRRSGFFSNVNSALLRSCWERGALPRRRVRRGSGLRARCDRRPDGRRPTCRRRRCCTRTTIRFVTFMRRYFDEYRGLRATIGHVEPASATPGAGQRSGAGARRYRLHARSRIRRQPAPGVGSAVRPPPRRPGAVRGARVALGAPALVRCGGGCRWRGTAAATTPVTAGGVPSTSRVKASGHRFDYVREHYRRQPAPLSPPRPPTARARLHIAWVIPPFRRGSGGHMTIFNIVERAGAQGTLVLDLGARPDLQARWPRRRPCDARSRITSRTLQGRRLHRLRRLARRGRRDGHRLADRLPALPAFPTAS